LKQEVEYHLSALLVLRKYLVAVRDNGTPGDVASLAEPLHGRLADLRKFDVTKRIKLASNVMVVSFVPGFGRRYTGNVLGSIEEKTVCKGSTGYVHSTVFYLLNFNKYQSYCGPGRECAQQL